MLNESHWQKIREIFDTADGRLHVIGNNQVDMLRWRLLFHQYIDRPLLGSYFTTLSHLGMRSLAVLPRHHASLRDHEPASHIQSRALIHKAAQQLQRSEEDNLFRRLFDLPGFEQDLADIWESLHWHDARLDQLAPSEPIERRQALQAVIDEVREQFSQHGFHTLPEFLRLAFAGGVDHATSADTGMPMLLMLPYRFDERQKYFLRLIDAIYQPHWHLFALSEIIGTDGRAVVTAAISQFGGLVHEQERITIHALQARSRKDFASELNREFPSHNNEGQVRVWKATTHFAEASLVARAVADRLAAGTQPTDIVVLYANARSTNFLAQAFADLGVPLDLQETMPARGHGIFALAHALIQLLSLDKAKSGILEHQQIVDYYTQPFQRRSRSGHYWDAYLRRQGIVLHGTLAELIQQVDGAEEEERELKGLAEAFADLLSAAKEFPGKAAPGQYADRFRKLLEKQSSPAEWLPASIRNLYHHSVEQVGRVLDSMVELDALYPGGMARDEFFHVLGHHLTRASLKVRATVGTDDGEYSQSRSPTPAGTAGVIARHLREGLHSPCQYLFIHGLSGDRFPVDLRINGLAALDERYAMRASAEEQGSLFCASLALVEQGTVISYAVDENPAPASIVFDLCKGDHLKKEEFVDQLPLFSHLPGGTPTWGKGGAPAVNWQPLLHPREELHFSDKAEGEIAVGLQAYGDVLDARAAKDGYGQFTGTVESALENESTNTPLAASASRIEDLAACPQQFWFKKQLRLDELEAPELTRFWQGRDRGSIFHDAAARLVDSLIEEFPGESYFKVFQQFNGADFVQRLQDCFEGAVAAVDAASRPLLAAVYQAQKDQFWSSFSRYFSEFHTAVLTSIHPLAEFVPLRCEWVFEDLALGNFILAGKIDRIDYHPASKSIIVLDYKCGRYQKDLTGIENLTRVQLPVYIEAIRHHQESIRDLAGAEIKNIGGVYAFTEKPASGAELVPDVNAAFRIVTDTFSERLQEGLAVLHDIIQDGHYFAVPRKKADQWWADWEAPCSFCDFQEICDRKPYQAAIERLAAAPQSRAYYEFMFRD